MFNSTYYIIIFIDDNFGTDFVSAILEIITPIVLFFWRI